MTDGTGIQWTHVPGYRGDTWNPTTGCTRVSPGCDHCYAFQLHDQRYVAKRAGKAVSGAQYDKPFSQVQLLEARLTQPLRTKPPTAYFVDSMADLFHADVPDEYLDRVFAAMALAPQHIFMILTKRPERMREYLRGPIPGGQDARRQRVYSTMLRMDLPHMPDEPRWPLPNVWLGVSTENQETYDARWWVLAHTPAAVRFISYEPALGPLQIGPSLILPDWVIVGGESGAHARPFDIAWARSLRDQCAAAGVAFFLKQLGRRPMSDLYLDERGTVYPTGDHRPIKLRHPHGGLVAEWPEDLRGSRAFPAVARRGGE